MTELKTVPFSNFYDWDENGKELYRDRLYGGITGKDSLVNKDGTVYSGKVEKKRIQSNISELRREREYLISEKNRLENDLKYIEKLAREKYRMAKPGERVYKVISE